VSWRPRPRKKGAQLQQRTTTALLLSRPDKPSRDDDHSFRLEAWITDNNQTGPSELLAQEG
jgi:hypothetical protein